MLLSQNQKRKEPGRGREGEGGKEEDGGELGEGERDRERTDGSDFFWNRHKAIL